MEGREGLMIGMTLFSIMEEMEQNEAAMDEGGLCVTYIYMSARSFSNAFLI